MSIKLERSLFLGLVPLKSEELPTGFRIGFRDSWYDFDGEGRWSDHHQEVISPDALLVTDCTNSHDDSRQTIYRGADINRVVPATESSCLGALIGYGEVYHWTPSKTE